MGIWREKFVNQYRKRKRALRETCDVKFGERGRKTYGVNFGERGGETCDIERSRGRGRPVDTRVRFRKNPIQTVRREDLAEYVVYLTRAFGGHTAF